MISWSASAMSNGNLPATAWRARKNATPPIAMLMLGPFCTCQLTMPPSARVLALNAPAERAMARMGSTDKSIIISRELPMEAYGLALAKPTSMISTLLIVAT